MTTHRMPTSITTKNGIRTTEPAPDFSASPSISMLSATERSEMMDDLCARFESTHMKYRPISIGVNDEKLLAFRNTLATFDDQVIRKLHTNAQVVTGDNNKIFLLVSGDASESEENIMNYLVLCEGDQAHERLFELGKGYSFNVSDAVRSLPTYPQLSYECTEEYFQKVIALTGVVTAIQFGVTNESHWESHENGRLITYIPAPRYGKEQLARITDDALVDLILERADCWEQIADIVVARGTDDASLIRSILDSENPALAEGML